MIGAAAGIGALPLDRDDFEAVMASTMPADKLEVNIKAYDMGVNSVYSMLKWLKNNRLFNRLYKNQEAFMNFEFQKSRRYFSAALANI